jgi:Tfp pilus assembly protein PilO
VKRQIPVALVIAPCLVILGAVAFFFLVKPNMDEKGDLEERIAEFQVEVELARAAQSRPEAPGEETIQVADLFRLTKAMPDASDMAGVILELKAVADSAGVDFISIAPQSIATRADGLTAIPIALTFAGDYYRLTDFLFRLRNLVFVRDGTLQAVGRLFVLDSLNLAEGSEGFPDVQAALTLSAFVYAPLPPAPVEPAEAPTEPADDPAAAGE